MKRIIVWITVLSLILAGVFAMNACNRKTDASGVSYEVNTPARDELGRVIITYGATVEDYLDRINITKIENGVSSTVPVEASMLVTQIDTSVVDGNGQILQFTYSGQMFSVPVVVKYKVEFVADGHTYRTYHVHNKKGLDSVKRLLEEEARTASGLGDAFDPSKLKLHELLAAPEKAGYSFVGWSEEGYNALEITNDFPSIIRNNITFTAIYQPVLDDIPELSAIDAVYGDLLADIKLPGTAIGEWQFANPAGTVGNVGENTFDVKFVELATGNVLKESTVTIRVVKKDAPELPELPVINAVYGDLLANIELPSFDSGKWQFENAEGTVGNVGTNEFKVAFVDALTNEVLEVRTITVVVAKKVVNFSSVVESFIYNGHVQLPTFQTDAPELNVENIQFNGDDASNYTDAGKYNYSFVIVDDNYEGTLEGTFEIKPVVIEMIIKLEKDNIGVGDSVPTATYEMSVPEGMDAADFEQFISLVIPTVDGEGEYTVTATTSNENIELSVTPATFTVEKRTLNVGAPALENKNSIRYGDQLSDVLFAYTPYGMWEWENPTDFVGEAGTVQHLAIFTPMADHKYEKEYYWVEFNVNQIKVEITVVESVFNYDGQEHQVSYVVTDEDGNEYTTLNVLGNVAYTNAGTYLMKFTLDERNYYIENGEKEVSLIIKKIDPVVEFDKQITVTWRPGLTLGQIVLPTVDNGYFVWGEAYYNVDSGKYEHNSEAAQTVLNANSAFESTMATFVPYDQENYELDHAIEFQVKVNKATPVIEGIENSYDFGYNGGVHNLPQAEVNPDKYGEETPEFTYTYEDGTPFTGVTEAGVYTVLVTLLESANNESAQITVTVTVAKADPEKPTQLQSNDIYYGDLALEKIKLPTHEQGVWSLKDVDATTTVGSVGRHVFVAVFTPTTGNYNTIEVPITVDVAKKYISVPEILAANQNQVYTGALLDSGLTSAEGYTVTDNGGINVGTYKVQIVLDTESYEWSTFGVEASFELEYNVVRADNEWTVDPTIKSEWIYGDTDGLDEDALAEYKGLASALVGEVVVLYAPQGTEAFEATFPTNAGAYTAKFIVTDSNYNDLVKTLDFVIGKKVVSTPAYTNTYFYTGSDIIADIPTSDLYSIAGNVAKYVGAYEATLTLNDSANYTWSGTDSESLALAYNVITSGVTLTVTIDGWTYGQTANAPVVTVDKTFSDEVDYIIEYSEDGIAWVTTVPTDAGTYTVRAKVEDTDNYNGAEATCSFTIAKATLTIEGVEDTYSKDYDGDEFTVVVATASNGATVRFVITKNGETVNAIVGAGEYVITYSVAQSANYLAATRTVTVTVAKADVTITAPTINGWTYGESAKEPSANFNEAFAQGEITFKYYTDANCTSEITDLTDAGTYYVKAFFAGNDNLNAAESEATEVVIAKKAVAIPSVSNKVYNGALQTSGLVAAEGYTVVDEGGTNVGTYTAVVTLVSDNYVWADGTSAAKELTYEITSIDNTEEITTTFVATYGDLLKDIITLPEGVQGTWSIQGATAETTVGNAGVNTFKAIFTPDENGNYNVREVEITVTVAKAVVNVPTEYTTEYVYTGSDITANIPTSTLYTIAGNVAKNVGSYSATLTLADSANYKWATTDAATVTVSYGITKASVTLTDLVLDGWTYNETANVPTVTITKEFAGDVVVSFEYLVDGVWVEDAPKNAGTYTVKAVVDGTSNYAGAEITAEFTIAKASVTINGANDSYSTTYTGSAYTITGVAASNGATLTKVITKGDATVDAIFGAGTYVVTYSVAESANFLGATKTVTVTVAKANVTVTAPTINGWTYGESANTPSANFNEAFAQGEITFKYYTDAGCTSEITTLEGANAGTYYVKAFFAGNDNLNACESEATSFAIAKKEVAIPSVSNKVYNGALQTSGLVAAEGYTVVDNGGTNAGTYTATVTLASDNYVWADGTSAAKELTYSITKATVTVGNPTIAGWVSGQYDATVNAPSVTTSITGVTIDYEYYVDGAWVTTVPTLAGDYAVRAVVEGTDNYDGATSAGTNFKVVKAEVVIPTIDAEYPYTGSAQKPTIADSVYYTVVGNDEHTAMGEYTITLIPKDEFSFVWAGETTDPTEKTLTYKIVKGTVTLSGLTINNWSYNETASIPTVTITKSFNEDVTVRYEYFAADGTSLGATAPSAVGTYKVKAIVDGTNNYDGAETEKDFEITKASATWTAPTFTGGVNNKFYFNQFGYSTSGLTATHAGQTVAGTFVFGAPTFVEGEGTSYITLTFTPADGTNYAIVEETYYVTFVTVATNTTTGVVYGSIEAALAAAVSGDTVQVKPHDTDLGPIYIKSDVEIKSGVTLILPYGVDGSGVNTISGDGTIDIPSATQSTGQYVKPADETKCHVMVVLAAGTKMTNNGTLQIAGQLSGGSGAAQYSGFTAGEHARLILDAGAELVNNGTIYAAGFIRELVKNNGSKVTLNSGSVLYQPFTVKDFPGGSVSYALYQTMGKSEPITAFSRFILMNVSPEMHISYGGTVRVWALLWAGDQINQTVGDMIGSGADNTTHVIALTDETYSYMVAKYDVDTEVCDLDIYGGAKTNGMKLSVKSLMTVTINTADALFAISYHYDVSLNKSDGQETATFTMGQRFKIMTGAKFTVGEGVILNATDIIVYEEFDDIRSDAGTAVDHPMRYPAKDPAIFTVNGTLNVNNFGGKIYTEVVGAVVNIATKASYTAYELKTVSGSSITTSVNAKNPITENAVFAGTTGEIAATTGVSWTSGKIVLNPDNGEEARDVYFFYNPASPIYPALPDVTKDGYAFQGWYNGETKVNAGDAMSAEPHTLTAKWSSGITITLDANGGTVTNSSLNIKSEEMANGYPALETPTRTGYTFLGWYYNGEKVEAGQALKLEANHTLTAEWEAQSFTVSVTTSNATVSGVTNGQSIQAGTTVTITVSFSESKNPTITVTDASGTKLVDATAAGSYTFTMPGSNVTVKASSEKSSVCVMPDTLVTLADGTQKRIDEVQPTDMLLVWNFYEGKYDMAPASILMNHGYDTVEVLTLVFADGTTIGTINGHGFFDEALNAFVIINTENVADFVGHSFVKLDGDSYTTTELVGYSVETRYTEVWSILTVSYYNCILEGLWSVTEAEVPNSPTYLMPFVVGEDMKYDSELMQADIEKYGLYTYEEFAMYCTEEQFEALGLKYFKVAVGKGAITREEIIYLLELHCS